MLEPNCSSQSQSLVIELLGTGKCTFFLFFWANPCPLVQKWSCPDNLPVLSLDRSERNVVGIELSLIAKAWWTRTAPRPSSLTLSAPTTSGKPEGFSSPDDITGESRLLALREPSWRLLRLNKHFCTNTHNGHWCGFVVMMSPQCWKVLSVLPDVW